MLDQQLKTGKSRSRREGAADLYTSYPGRQPASAALIPPKREQKKSAIKAAFSALKRAGITVEAAGALPIFVFALCSIICMLEMFAAFSKRMVKLQGDAERAGQIGAVAGSLTGSGDGLSGEEIINLPLPFIYHTRFIPAPSLSVAARGRVHAWTGRDGSASDLAAEKEKDPLVYVTDYESVYHTSSECTHLHLQIRGVSYAQMKGRRNSSGARYKPCQKCAGRGRHGSVVYISPEGDCWHNDPECSGLKRSTHLVHLSETKGVHKCQRCQQREGG